MNYSYGMKGARDLADAHTRWPSGWVPDAEFLVYLSERRGAAADERDVSSLYLACACVRGVPDAIRAFEAEYVVEITQAARRKRLSPDATIELTQTLREALIVGREGKRPTLEAYAGKGDLKAWLRVTASRAAIKVSQSTAKAAISNDESILALRSAGGDPDLLYLRAAYATPFREAFTGALEGLSAKDRNLLRQHFLEAMTIDDLGALYKVHRATAARWVEAARERLLDATQKTFAEKADLRPDECDSVMRIARSRLDVTLRRLLA